MSAMKQVFIKKGLQDGLVRGILRKLKDQAAENAKIQSGNHDLFLNKMKQNDPTFDQ